MPYKPNVILYIVCYVNYVFENRITLNDIIVHNMVQQRHAEDLQTHFFSDLLQYDYCASVHKTKYCTKQIIKNYLIIS